MEIITDKRFILKQDKTLPSCAIYDLDGTIALINGRGIFDDTKLYKDIENTSVTELMRRENEHLDIIIISGRDAKSKKPTEEWLFHRNIPYKKLLMRDRGDNRADNVVKLEIYQKHILNKYNVAYVVDDRDSVVAMWRGLGLCTLQPYYGDF
jgi:hypothetical protein